MGPRARRQWQSTRRALLGAGVALAAQLPGPAIGAEAGEPRRSSHRVRVEFSAPPTCPDVRTFARAVRERAPERAPDPAARAYRTFRVTLSELPWRAFGRLEILEPDGAVAVRSMEGADCSEVATGLALVAALALESEATPAPPAQASPEPTEPESTPTLDDPEASPEPGEIESVGMLPVMRVEDAPSDPWSAALGPPAKGSWWGAGLHVDAIAGVLSGITLAPRLFIDARLEGSGVFSPSARLSAMRAIERQQLQGGAATLVWTAGRGDLCPARFELGRAVSLFPCATVEAGWVGVQANGTELRQDSSDPMLWLALGGVTRAQWILFDVLLLELQMGALLPLTRSPVASRDQELLYRPGSIAGYASAGIGGRFP